MYRSTVFDSSKLINSIYIVGIQNYDIECKYKKLIFIFIIIGMNKNHSIDSSILKPQLLFSIPSPILLIGYTM